MTDEMMQQALDVHQRFNGSRHKGAESLGLSESAFGHRVASAKAKGMTPNGKSDSKKGRSLDEFRAQHDKDFIVPARIKEGLKQLGDGWAYEMEFVKLAGVSLGDLGNYREAFAEHVVIVRRDGKRAWAGSVSIAAKMREMVS
jgi:hypothetical protein